MVVVRRQALIIPDSIGYSKYLKGSNTMNENFTKGKLRKIPYALLPAGSVRAQGWLFNQLKLQRNGVLNDMERYPHYGENSEWRGGKGENWENGPYYLRGLVALAYVLDDAELKERAQTWIEAILASSREDGMFGPRSNEDWWSRMPALMALRDYYEATERAGSPDARVLPFMENYFRGQLKNLPEHPLYSWAQARGGDNLDSVIWLYNRLYKEEDPDAADWLLDLAGILRSQTTDWTELMQETTVRTHVVNTSQAMKTPPLWYLLSNDERDRDALEAGYRNISLDHGRIDGLPNSDEAARDNQSIRGSELCGIVEGLFSTEIAFTILGKSYLCDQLERLAYNALPAAYAPDYSGHVYYILQNQVLATTGYHEFDCDHGDSSAFGAPCGFDCCFANNHMGWAKFVKSMWMSAADGGLAVTAYGPSVVEAEIVNGKIARFTEITEYPFRESVKLDYHGDNANFTLHLPIPGWCKAPEISVNGEILAPESEDGFFLLKRDWIDGDSVEITFPMEITFSEWYNRSVALTRGPLIYCLKIAEDWRQYDSNDTRELKGQIFGCVKKQEVYPASRWNYALLPDADRVRIEYHPIAEQPFTAENAPISLYAMGQTVPEWKLDGNHAGAQPFGGVLPDETAQREIELIPYGAARLKITHFPRITDDPVTIRRDDPMIGEKDGQTVSEFRNVTLPVADDYTLKIFPESGEDYRLFVNGREAQIRDNRVENLKKCSDFVKFGSYNRITFIGDPVAAIEIEPQNPVTAVCAEKIETRAHGITVYTNVSRSDYGYELDFGEDPRSLNRHFRRFGGRKARIGGLTPDKDYYFRLSSYIGGKRVGSEVYHVRTAKEEAAQLTIPCYEGGFEEANWAEYGEAVSERYDGLLVVATSHDYKALLKGGEGWKDYEASAHICLRKLTGDAGLLFHVTEPSAGANAYRGYYFGITPQGAVLGSADGNWHELSAARFKVKPDHAYRLTVRISGGRMVCLLDGEPIFRIANTEHTAGSAGLRTYGAPLAAEWVKVRPLAEDEIAELQEIPAPDPVALNIMATTAFELVQVTFPKIPGAEYYRIDYGSSSGFYQNTVTDIRFNPYKGSEPFLADKTAFTFTGTTCYLQMSAWQGDRRIACSEEIAVNCGKDRTDP